MSIQVTFLDVRAAEPGLKQGTHKCVKQIMNRLVIKFLLTSIY